MAIRAWGEARIGALQRSALGRLVERYLHDRADLLAAVVAYNALFSMFPIILAILAILGLFLRDPAVLRQAQTLIFGALPPQAVNPVLEIVDGSRQGAGLLGLVGLLLLFWSGSGLFGALETAFDQIYGVPVRSFVRQRLMSAGMILLFASVVIVIVATAGVVGFLTRVATSAPLLGPLFDGRGALVVAIGGLFVSTLAAFVLTLSIYYVVPNLRLSFQHVLPGAVFAAVGLIVLAQIFPIYVTLAGGFSQYGAIFALFFLLMTWAYFVAQVFLVGAEINTFLRPIPAPVASAKPGPHALEPRADEPDDRSQRKVS